MDEFKRFMSEYHGAIIGAIISILIICTGLYKLMIAVIAIILGIFIGNYVQKNKYTVKEKIKNFIDRM